MDYVRELPGQELAVMTFGDLADLETFVVKVCAEGDFDYEVIPEKTVVIPKDITAYCRRRANELRLEFSEDPLVVAARAMHPPSRASWDAFTEELEKRFGAPPPA